MWVDVIMLVGGLGFLLGRKTIVAINEGLRGDDGLPIPRRLAEAFIGGSGLAIAVVGVYLLIIGG
jgi:hypothetical protein